MSVMLQRFTDKPNLGASDPSFRYNVFRSPGSLSPLLGSIGLWGGGGGVFGRSISWRSGQLDGTMERYGEGWDQGHGNLVCARGGG